jgi:hypothetical protein
MIISEKNLLKDRLDVAIQQKQNAFEEKNNRKFNFWVTKIELIENKLKA